MEVIENKGTNLQSLATLTVERAADCASWGKMPRCMAGIYHELSEYEKRTRPRPPRVLVFYWACHSSDFAALDERDYR